MAGTYFPRDAFIDALKKLAEIWSSQPENVEKQAESLSQAIRSAAEIPSAEQVELDDAPLQRAIAELSQLYDSEHGGFGSKPKFPPHGALRLLALQAAEGDSRSREMLTNTLDAMWCGGIHDHLGGGFHRYSTDERWLLPHFEKMLYDNAQLMRAFTEAYAVTGHLRYRAAVEDIFAWLAREMTHADGAFFSAIDSESEGGEEGRFYTWSIGELEDVLGRGDAEWFAELYRCTEEGNFLEEARAERNRTNILHLQVEHIDQAGGERAAALRKKLLAARKQREYPHLDDKILTGWNGLMISALARAGAVCDEPRYTQAAHAPRTLCARQSQSQRFPAALLA
jgi:uncharacterized protein